MPEPLRTILLLLAIVAALLTVLRTRGRLAERLGRRLDRIEGRLATLDAALRRIEWTLTEPGPSASGSISGIRHDRPHEHGPSPARPNSSAREPGIEGPQTDIEPGPTLISVPDLSGPGRSFGSQAEAARRASASVDLASRFGRVWEMADEGATADRIASSTGQPIGQVELVLNLRRRLLDDAPDDRTGEVPG